MKKGELKQFCPKGHNTFECGKDTNGYCKLCKKEWKSPLTNQFCIEGHDTFVTGRYKNGHCVVCKKEWSIDYVIGSQPRFCINGHDTFICGRQIKGRCKACSKVSHQKGKIKTNLRLKERWLLDIFYRLKRTLRNRLKEVLKENKKQGSAAKNLGCTLAFLKQYLEAQFRDGMTWSNWGTVWELDHKKALWRFNLSNKGEFLKAAHFTNLQPLLIEEHRKKSSQDLKDFFAYQRSIK